MIRTRNIFAALTIAACVAVGGVGAAGASAAPSGGRVATSASVVHYKNCTAMHKHYKHGVGKVGARDKVKGKTKPVTNFTRNTALYNKNKSMDRDKDGVACEAH